MPSRKEREENEMNETIVTVRMDGRTVGRLTQARSRRLMFQYDSDWLSTGFSISPIQLPLLPVLFEADGKPFDGNFGVFDDSLADGWSALVFGRYLRRQGTSLQALTLPQQLMLVGTNGRGALEYLPDCSSLEEADAGSLQALADEARRVLDAEGELTLEKAWRRGGSSGGTRPKVYLAHEGEEWLVKFADRTDPPEVGRLEYETSLVARQCGIEMEPTKLFEGRFFGTRRFDRTAGGGKVHVVSLSGLMGINYRMPNADYGHLFWACNELTHSQKELWKVFRLMAFNLLIGNCDDHPKNFAFVHRDGLWHLAPAYDLLPCEGRNGMHALSVNRNYRNPGRSDALALATAFGLAGDEAAAVWDDMQAIVAQSGLLGWQK